MDTPPERATRRKVLSAVALAGVIPAAGCGSIWNQPGATDVVAANLGAEPRVVSITVTNSGEAERHTSRTMEIGPGETVDPVNDGKLPTNASYTVEVIVEDGPQETFEWDDPGIERAPLWVVVDDSQNVRFLLQAG